MGGGACGKCTGGMRVAARMCVALGLASAAGAEPQLHIVMLGNAMHESSISALSGDGSAGCGFVHDGSRYVAVRWTLLDGIEALTTSPGDSFATAISADGGVVVGLPSFRWTAGMGEETLPPSPGNSTFSPFALSADGNVVAGFGLTDEGMRALRWEQGDDEVQVLGILGEDFTSDARGISGDGAWITGYSSGVNGARAILWSEEIGLVGLGVPEGWTGSAGFAVSADGGVVGGMLSGADSTRGFYWTAEDGFEAIALEGMSTSSEVYCVSGDGSALGGISTTAEGVQRAIVWTRAGSTVDLSAYMASLGVDLDGWTLVSCHAISADGSAVAGEAIKDGVPFAVGFVITGIESLCLPMIVEEPAGVTVCRGGEAALSVGVAYEAGVTYQWRRGGLAIDVAEVPSAGTATLVLGVVGMDEVGTYDVVVSSACGSVVSAGAEVARCDADFDCSGFVDIEDYTAFTLAFEEGGEQADFDGSGFVDVDDFAAFAVAFEAGC